MKHIIGFLFDRPKITNLIFIFILLSGFITMLSLQNEGYPPINFQRVSISTVYPDASPEDIETKITSKIEDKLIGISGLKKIQSSSLKGLSQIVILLEDSTDFDETTQEISDAIKQVRSLPKGVTSGPTLFKIKSDIFPISEIAISGTGSYEEKRKVAKALEYQLRDLSSINDIEKIGYRNREIRIETSAKSLQKNVVSLADIYQTLTNQNIRLSAGDIISDNQEQQTLIIDTQETEIETIKNWPIRSSFEGKKLTVGKVASISDGFEKYTKKALYNGSECIQFLVLKKQEADILDATNEIKKTLAALQKSLPDTVTVDLIFDYTTESQDLLDLVIANGQLGFILVLLCLFVFLNFRAAFWTALGIPFSILFAFILFPVLDTSFNFITLISMVIVLGMLVDDAILVSENIYYYKEQGLPNREAAIKGTTEVLWPVITTVTTTIVAFMPMMMTKGVFGEFIRYFPIVISLTLIGSLFESLFILPTHIGHAKLTQKKTKKTIMKRLEAHYTRLVKKTLQSPKITTSIIMLILILITGICLKYTHFKLFPSDDGPLGMIRFQTPKGYSLSQTEELAKKITNVVAELPKSEITGYVLTVGERSPRFISYGINTNNSTMGHIVFYLTPIKDRKRTATEITNEIEKKIERYKDLFESIDTSAFKDGPPIGSAITITIACDTDTIRNQAVEAVQSMLANTSGVKNISTDAGTSINELQLTFNRVNLSQLGLTPKEISQTIQWAYKGIPITSVRKGNEEITYRLILSENDRKTYQTIDNLEVYNKFGQLIPLKNLVQYTPRTSPQVINHYKGKKSITIFADLSSKTPSVKQVNADIRATLDPFLETHPELSTYFGGEEQETKESLTSLYMAMGLALIGIYFILVFLFNSLSQPLLVMGIVPISFIGVLVAFTLTGMPLSFPAMIGMVGLTGVVVNNSLVLISFLNRYAKKPGDLIDNLSEGAARRLRPILLTTITTTAGLLPTAYGFGGQNPVVIPIVTAIAWGLVFSTFVCLLLLPSLYLFQYKFLAYFSTKQADVTT